MLSKIAIRICHHMYAKGWSKKKLAKESKLAESALNRFLSGNGGISLTTFIRICDALGVDANTLIYGAKK